MKKVITFAVVLMLLFHPLPPGTIGEELPEGFYEREVVQAAIANMIDQLREGYTPIQLEVIYQASKFLHDEYFTDGIAVNRSVEGKLLEPGLYEVGIDIPAGNYYFEGVRGRLPSNVNVYPSIDKMRVIDEIQSVSGFGYGYDCGSAVTGKVILQDGWFLKVVQGPAVIHSYPGLSH